MKIDKILLATVWLVIANGASAAVEHAPWPGGIAVIEIGPATAPAPAATFNDKASARYAGRSAVACRRWHTAGHGARRSRHPGR